MLKLRVKLKDEVFIGDNIKVIPLFLDLPNRTVELGFVAPKDIPIMRKSFLRHKEKQNIQQPESNSNL